VLGKTVTTEFALMTPGPTTNPHRASHTPGGSSSGSAAAVAAGMVDVGIGTQTYGSVVRPSSFCGVFGFKPTLAAVPTAGVRPLAPAFDTVGWMAGTLDLVVRVLVALTGAQSGTRFHDPRVGTVYAGRATRLSDAIRALPGIQTAVSSAEVNVQPVGLEGELELLSSLHGVVAEHQIGRALKGEYEDSRPGLSTPLKEFVRRGLAISEDACAEAVAELAARAPTILDVFSTVDVVLGPSARGEAPRGLAFTGDPCFCTPWTALGCPALNVPASTGATGLPIGVQLVAAPGRDADLLHAARVLFPSLPPSAAQVGGW
jgi:Asp-tRNA(Asn)/Glu-tRNA(Gln) amidotransferase A subunit family amidase